MPLTGDIQTFSLSAIGRLLHQEKKTGILKVSSQERETNVYFRGGDIVFISGDLAAELSLGALLKDKKLVTDKDIEDSLGVARKENRRLGVVLMESGLVSQDNLVQVLNYQFKEAISAVLTWREGAFVYEDGLKGFVEDIRLKMDPIRLVAEAEKWKAYRSLIPNDHVVFEIKEGAQQSDSFSTDGALRVMLMIDGKRDVYRIIADTSLPRLGVYRALAALAEQGAIEVSGAASTSQTGKMLDTTRVIQYFMNIIDEIANIIARELGERKAHSMLARSLQRSFDDQKIAESVIPGGDPDENTRRIYDQLQKQDNAPDGRKLELDFKRAVYFLLQDEYQVLGFKAARDTIARLVESPEHEKEGEQAFAGRMLTFYRELAQDEGYFKGGKSFSDTSGLAAVTEADSCDDPKPSMENIGGAAIIALYSRVIQTVMHEMEAEIGTKAGVLLSGIIEKSDYYEKFLSQYRVDDDVQANVNRIRDHISREGHRLGKYSFISGFQQTLSELLLAKKQLLGKKSASATILSIETFLAGIAQEEFRPLTTNLMTTLKRII